MNKQPPDNPTFTVIKLSLPVNKAGEPDPFADRRVDNLGVQDYKLVKYHMDRSGNPIVIPLFLNGAALIESEVVTDDGVETKRFFVIIGITSEGFRLNAIKVPVNQFASMNWLAEYWGNRIILAPGNGNKDNARAAAQVLSGVVKTLIVYRFTGWLKIDGQWLYLHGGGAIGADGQNDQVTVELDPGNMQRYRSLPPNQEKKHYATLLLELLNISPKNPAIGVALVCAVCRAPLGEAADINFSLHFSGLTGSLKSSAAALALGFFGDFVEVASAGRFPGSFSDSALDLAIKGHSAKDVVFVVDEFNPNSFNRKTADEMHEKLDFLIRSTGNRSGRGTRTTNHEARAARFPRGLVFVTGEDIPKSPSLLGRMLIVEIKPGDIDITELTRHQMNAAEGKYRQIMANYLAWLAPRMNDLKTRLPKKIQSIIEEFSGVNAAHNFGHKHLRFPQTYASLLAGFDVFLEYLMDAEIISPVRINDIYEETAATLHKLINAQGEYQQQNDEARIFRELLQACFVSGKVHVGNHLTQGSPILHPHQWGWRANEKDGDLMARGDLIGWIHEARQQLWLNPAATYAAVQRLASAQGEAFTLNKSTLWKRLLERGILLEPEVNKPTGKLRPDVKRPVDSGSKRVLIFHTSFITDMASTQSAIEPAEGPQD